MFLKGFLEKFGLLSKESPSSREEDKGKSASGEKQQVKFEHKHRQRFGSVFVFVQIIMFFVAEHLFQEDDSEKVSASTSEQTVTEKYVVIETATETSRKETKKQMEFREAVEEADKYMAQDDQQTGAEETAKPKKRQKITQSIKVMPL